MRRVTFSFLATACCLLLASCTEVAAPAGLPDRDPQLAVRLVRQEGALLLDVRTSREFAATHIPGARNIDIEQLSDRLNEVNALVRGDRERPIVVYCTAGSRAARAKRILVSAGYRRVTNLGGIRDWPSHQ